MAAYYRAVPGYRSVAHDELGNHRLEGWLSGNFNGGVWESDLWAIPVKPEIALGLKTGSRKLQQSGEFITLDSELGVIFPRD